MTNKQNSSILFLGASITSGFGLPTSLSFPNQIQQVISQAELDYQVLNAAAPGASTVNGLAQMKPYLQDPYHVSHLFIALGLSDVVYGTPLSEIERNLRQIIQHARQANPDMKIFLFQAEIFQFHVMSQLKQRDSQAFEHVFQVVADSEDVTLLPFLLTDVARQDHLNLPDRLHPNEAGMKLVADNVWQQLRPYL